MRTNPEIKNAYLRSLLAHELMGYRESYYKNAAAISQMSIDIRHDYAVKFLLSYDAKRHAARNAFGRVDLHLRRHGTELILGNPGPLKEYPAGFAGH